MYSVSEKFLRAVQENTRKYYWTGTIATAAGAAYEFGNKDILKGSGYISNKCCNGNEIELGTVYAAELGITLLLDIDRYTLDGAEVKLFYHLVLPDGTEEAVPMGIYEVSEANRSISCLELKAYDRMVRFEKDFTSTTSSGTAYEFLALACQQCNVPLAHAAEEIDVMPNGKEVLGIYADNDIETWRDLVYYVAQTLASFAVINRSGELELRQYGSQPVWEIPAKHRAGSTFSDFVTRYTSVNSTNVMTQTAEYYALETDDALTMNLGINYLLQYGMKGTRKRMLERILDAVSVIRYVPFDSSTIGNPALDLGDVVQFSGGHADNGAISCITGYEYKINGKHALKCVGKNPRLATAKSKNDKNIIGLLNQAEAQKITYYNFVNASEFTIQEPPQEVISIEYVSMDDTSAMFLAEILIEAFPDAVTRQVTAIDGGGNQLELSMQDVGEIVLTATYRSGMEVEETFQPAGTFAGGKHCLTLFYPITGVKKDTSSKFAVLLSASGGTVRIGASQIRATISGQGLVSGLSEWDGKIEAEDTFGSVPIQANTFTVDMLTSSIEAVFTPRYAGALADQLGRISFGNQPFKVGQLTERLGSQMEEKFFTVDTSRNGAYDSTYVEICDGAFALRTAYSFWGVEKSIDKGRMCEIAINMEQFVEVMGIEVV